eukprot:TRINITY_DN4825_c0_g3_i1.p1 TRINITY_DN4825_c0_g3~~TRINITY_DN4825_c0_g3_i1.p1  ORF type:complete len:300 (+),score=69.85 TRINITY_DN4825_c0_g3_i1:47-946(+)
MSSFSSLSFSFNAPEASDSVQSFGFASSSVSSPDDDAMQVDSMADQEDSATASTECSSDDEAGRPEGRSKKRKSRSDPDGELTPDRELRATHEQNMHYRFNSDAWEHDFKVQIVVERAKEWIHQHRAALPRSAFALEDKLENVTKFHRYAEASTVLTNLLLNRVVILNANHMIERPTIIPAFSDLNLYLIKDGAPLPNHEGFIGWDFVVAVWRAYMFFAHSYSSVKDVKLVMETLVETGHIKFSISARALMEMLVQQGLIVLGGPVGDPSKGNRSVRYPFLQNYDPRANRALSVLCRDV